MTGVLDHPAEYEFPDITCIGEGCIWWDDFHPRSAFHRILAQDIADRVHIAFAGGV
jgi:phospholipase/lecithinase/hemolysin